MAQRHMTSVYIPGTKPMRTGQFKHREPQLSPMDRAAQIGAEVQYQRDMVTCAESNLCKLCPIQQRCTL